MIRWYAIATLLLAGAVASKSSVTFAQDLEENEPYLVITNDMASPSKKHIITMDRSTLESLQIISFETSTIWTEEVITFSGPALREVLSIAGVTSSQIRLKAANNYQVEIPTEILVADAPIIATRINDQHYGLREKGPFWLVFPYDRDKRYRTETVMSYSIWQLTEIVSVNKN